jgi:hypothetical protein
VFFIDFPLYRTSEHSLTRDQSPQCKEGPHLPLADCTSSLPQCFRTSARSFACVNSCWWTFASVHWFLNHLWPWPRNARISGIMRLMLRRVALAMLSIAAAGGRGTFGQNAQTSANRASSDDITPIQENGEWGYADKGGKVVIKPQFSRAGKETRGGFARSCSSCDTRASGSAMRSDAT